MKSVLLAIAALALLAAPGALAWGNNLAERNQIAMDSEVGNIYSAVNGYDSTFAATQQNAAIASAVPYGTIPNLYLTNSYEGGDPGYYWGRA